VALGEQVAHSDSGIEGPQVHATFRRCSSWGKSWAGTPRIAARSGAAGAHERFPSLRAAINADRTGRRSGDQERRRFGCSRDLGRWRLLARGRLQGRPRWAEKRTQRRARRWLAHPGTSDIPWPSRGSRITGRSHPFRCSHPHECEDSRSAIFAARTAAGGPLSLPRRR